MIDISKSIDDGGGYDLSEIAQAREVNSKKTGDEKGYEEVEPLFITVTGGESVRSEELEARSIIIEYDRFDNIVSVEVL